METAVDAGRNLDCAREQLAYLIGYSAQRSSLEALEGSRQ
jgi:hypothetical protein